MCDEILLAPSANTQNEIRKRRNKVSISTKYGDFLNGQYHESNWGLYILVWEEQIIIFSFFSYFYIKKMTSAHMENTLNCAKVLKLSLSG
jgi:hypothetical protein